MTDKQALAAPAAAAPAAPFYQAMLFWLKLGFISFGGPAGQIALMHEELVDKRRWISERRFLHALNYCMMLPGPEAQQRTEEPLVVGDCAERLCGDFCVAAAVSTNCPGSRCGRISRRTAAARALSAGWGNASATAGS